MFLTVKKYLTIVIICGIYTGCAEEHMHTENIIDTYSSGYDYDRKICHYDCKTDRTGMTRCIQICVDKE